MANNIAVAITADTADLTAKMAVAKATMQDVGRTMREVARDVAAGDTTAATKTRLLEVSEAYSKASNDAALYARQMRSTQVVANDTAVSAGQQKFAIRDLSAQMQDLGVGFSMAAQSAEPFKMAMMTITQQSSQVLGAIQLLRAESGGFLGWLAGPWGAGIMAAASILANLAIAHMDSGKAAKHQQDAEEDLTKALEQLQARSIQATASIEDGIRASLNDAFAKRQQAAETLKAAEANLALARSELAKKQKDAPRDPDDPLYLAGAMQVKQETDRLNLVQAAIEKAQANVDKGTTAIRGFQAEIARNRIEQSFSADGAAAARYSQQVSDLAKAYREGSISLDQYARSVVAAKAAEEAAKNSDKGGGRTSSRSGSTSGRSGNAEARAEARAEEQALREALQERIAVTRQEESLAEEKARTEISLSQIALQAKLDDIAAEQRAGRISGTQAVQQRAAVNRELLGLDQDLQQRVFAAKLRELQTNQRNYAAGTREYRDYARQIELLTQQHENRLAILKQQGATRQRQIDQQVYAESNRRMQGLAGNWAQNLARMATLQQGFSATVSGLWQSVQSAVASVIEQILQKWIVAQLIKIGLIKTEHATSVQAQASLAGAGGVASMAAAPFPINLTAPAFGASMAAAATSFGLAGFAKGTNELPTDMVAQIHAGERIVPQADNRELMRLVRIGAGVSEAPGMRSGGSGNGNGSPIHINISALDGHSVRRMFLEHGDKIAAAVTEATRQGWRPRPSRR